MKEQIFIKHVISEIEALRIHASSEQKAKLDFDSFEPMSGEQCIYGQMTGDCFSAEAAKLIKKCSSKLVTFNTYLKELSDLESYPKIEATEITRDNTEYYTLLEQFITMLEYNKYNQNILSYIKGTSRKLTLKKLVN